MPFELRRSTSSPRGDQFAQLSQKSIPQLKKELQSLGVDTTPFVEKRELVEELAKYLPVGGDSSSSSSPKRRKSTQTEKADITVEIISDAI